MDASPLFALPPSVYFPFPLLISGLMVLCLAVSGSLLSLAKGVSPVWVTRFERSEFLLPLPASREDCAFPLHNHRLVSHLP